MADEETRVFRITNTGPGPRQILTPTGGATIQKGGNKVIRLSENDFKAIRPYVDLKQLTVEEVPESELPKPAGSGDIGGEQPAPSGSPVEAAIEGGQGDIVPDEPTILNEDGEAIDGETEIDEDDGKPTHVEHRGFGRFYGMSGDEKLTQAMTEDEANAYAEEHGLTKPVTANPSTEEAQAEEPAPSADETEKADETETEEQQS